METLVRCRVVYPISTKGERLGRGDQTKERDLELLGVVRYGEETRKRTVDQDCSVRLLHRLIFAPSLVSLL